jgi:two-component system, LytTR family, sensor kinase
MNKNKIYWACQLFGWFLFALLNYLFIQFDEEMVMPQAFLGPVVSFFTGIVTSHLYRNFIIRFGWLRYSFLKLSPRFIAASMVLAIIYYFLTFFITTFFVKGSLDLPEFSDFISDWLNLSFVYLVWSLIYFLFNFIENYKQEEIKNLKWEASRNELELNRLKAQLNPHFMFNSMNSIRALVDEDPAKAKAAITQLSNILRTALQMGKNKLIPFDEELNLVKDYLALEKTRYEERLTVTFEISPSASAYKIPPMMVQTLVENAIKHGISKLIDGGEVSLEARPEGNTLLVRVINDGSLGQKPDEFSGFGIKNTMQRLNLLFGDKASFKIKSEGDGKVIAELIIPKYESTDS